MTLRTITVLKYHFLVIFQVTENMQIQPEVYLINCLKFLLALKVNSTPQISAAHGMLFHCNNLTQT